MIFRTACAVVLLGTVSALSSGARATDMPPAVGGEAPALGSADGGTTTEAIASPTPASKPEPIRLDPPAPDRLRPSLLPLAQPLWSDLTPLQQQVLAPFAAQWNALPVTEKRAWADLAKRFPRMKAGEQQRVEKRIAEWAALTPDQRRLARANYRLVKQQQVGRENLLAEWDNYQSMTPEQRSVLGSVGTSNTAARHVAAQTGLAKNAAQPLPRRLPPMSAGIDGGTTSAGGVTHTVGPAGRGR
jgi:hypothetical protein